MSAHELVARLESFPPVVLALCGVVAAQAPRSMYESIIAEGGSWSVQYAGPWS
jgi:hypothetical protein